MDNHQVDAQADLKDLLLKILKHLGGYDFRSFTWRLRNRRRIPESELENADREKTVDLMMHYFPQEVLAVTVALLEEIPRKDLVALLSQMHGAGGLR